MSIEPKEDKTVKHPCYFCVHSLKRSESETSDLVVLETITSEGHKYECGIGNNDCSIINLYRMFDSHRHKLFGTEITDKPMRK